MVDPTRPDPGVRAQLAEQIRAAIAGAVHDCDHPDTGQPISYPERGCALCATAAVMALFPDVGTERTTVPGYPRTLAAVRTRYVALTDWHRTPDNAEHGGPHE